jgi:HTH-type transcriptional regulator / antitoxin HigA
MEIKPIKNETDYQNALDEISVLFDADLNTAEGDKLEVLTTLVQAYEEEHYPIDLPDAVDALNYWMESRGLERKDLQAFIGSRARISEILNRKRELTLAMIRKLNEGLHIPAALLIKRSKYHHI